jgi:hypothetical protein
MTPEEAGTPSTYSVGDYVWIRRSDRRHELQLGRIVDARSRLVARGEGWACYWKVRLLLAHGWKAQADSRPVLRALSAAEVTHNRRLGLIPRRTP